ncbi:MAG: hypothetical protein QOI95_2237 [Acidimicrobiaceae bacterium]|jgi:hypothetical protein
MKPRDRHVQDGYGASRRDPRLNQVRLRFTLNPARESEVSNRLRCHTGTVADANGSFSSTLVFIHGGASVVSTTMTSARECDAGPDHVSGPTRLGANSSKPFLMVSHPGPFHPPDLAPTRSRSTTCEES